MLPTRATLLLVLLSVLLGSSTGQEGVYLSIRGSSIANNGYVDYDDIGDNSDQRGLLCHTPRGDCCLSSGQGSWHFPDGTEVQSFQVNGGLAGAPFFAIGRGTSKLRLYRVNSNGSPPPQRGRFYCMIPDDIGHEYRYVNILDIGSVSITGQNSGTSGKIFSIACSTEVVTQSDSPYPNFEWFFGPSNISLPSNVAASAVTKSGITYTSTLQFSPLLQSHAGMYTCRLGGNEGLAAKTGITVLPSTIQVVLTDYGYQPIVGQNYRITCNISGIAGQNYSLQWKKNGAILPLTQQTLTFIPFKPSDAGQYTCELNIEGEIYTDQPLLATSQVPAPTSVTITSNPANPIHPAGSDVTLTCTVELSSVIDVSVTVNTVWSGPDGFMTTNTAQPVTTVMGSNTTYTSTAMISSFGRAQSGQYTCTTTIRSTSVLLTSSTAVSATISLTTGVYLSLEGNSYSNSSVIEITEIGIYYSGLQCHTDRSPCCNVPPYRAGEWYFPNQAQVPVLGRATTFFRNRGDDGTVNLNRLSSGVTSPTGLFCCEVPDAANINQRLCAYVVPQVSVQINNNGVIATGESYTLTCSYSGYEHHIWNDDPIVVINWTKTGGTPTQIHTNIDNQLTFSSLKLSDAGEYTCTVKIYDGTVLLSTGHKRTTVHLLVPPFEIILVADDEQQPVLSQFSITLTCTVEFSPLVDVPVTVYTNLTGPQTAKITLATRVKYTKYSGSISMRPGTGTYQCTPIIDDSPPYIRGSHGSKTARKSLVVGDAFFQLKLLNLSNCRSWMYHQVSSYRTYIRDAIFEALELHCQCKIPQSNILRGKFSCRDSTNSDVTYRSTLIGTYNTNATELLKFLQDWVNTGPTIEMDWYYVDIDSSCPVAVSSLKEAECAERVQTLTQNGNNSSYSRCAQYLSDQNIAQCFEGCIARNGN